MKRNKLTKANNDAAAGDNERCSYQNLSSDLRDTIALELVCKGERNDERRTVSSQHARMP